MIEDICTAIHKHRRLRITYEGHERIVEPYAYGANESHVLLRAYQLSGFSNSRSQGWKLFREESISEVALLDATFAKPRDGYMRNDPSMEVIYCEI